MFSILPKANFNFLLAFILLSANAFNFGKSTILSLGKVFADDKINVTKELKFVLGREEKIVGKGKNAGNQHFLLFPHFFQKAPFTEVLKVRIEW